MVHINVKCEKADQRDLEINFIQSRKALLHQKSF